MASKAERFEMRLDEEMLSRVDKWRSNQDNMPCRAEAMRRLVEIGLVRITSEAVKFTDGEKLLTIMMRDVYKHLKIEGEIDADFMADVIYGGHYWAPIWDMTGLFHEYQDRPQDVKFVCDALEMWSFIEEGYEKLSTEDRTQLDKDVGYVQFIGFDGNNESSHLGIARFFIEKMNRFSRFNGRELNSHCPVAPRYKRMLEIFEPMRKSLVGVRLSANQIAQILKAKNDQ